MEHFAFFEYVEINGEKLFTTVLLPEKGKRFPTVVCRSPYVKHTVDKSEEDLVQSSLISFRPWLERGYAVVFQHCRGQGKSSGAFIPYIQEREDGLEFRKWIRGQSFYNGELFLVGKSYTSSLHYATAPFEKDILGAVFEVQDSERYNLWYRNGQMRKGHANWHFGLYKSNCGLNKNFDMASFSELPIIGLSEKALGERADDFEEMLTAQHPTNEFWQTRFGGSDTKGALINADIPILLTTGYNDFYVGGVFRMWNALDEKTRAKSALIVSPYNHGDNYYTDERLAFPNGKISEEFGSTYQIDWIDNIRNGYPLKFKKGVITYYRAFENRWENDFYASETKCLSISLGDSECSFTYDPLHPTAFAEEGRIPEECNPPSDTISLSTEPFEKDIFIRGQIKANLTVSSTCEDSSFYVRISIVKDGYTYVLRHDIRSLCYELGEYQTNSKASLNFSFDEYAFLLKKGEHLQIDIASTDNNTYVSHTNQKGDYYLQTTAKTAVNTVHLDQSHLFLPIEE